MIGKLFLTLATLALLHGMNVLSDISHYSSCSIAAYSTYEHLSLLKALGKPEGSLPLDIVYESILALILGLLGASLNAPPLKDITWASEMKKRTIDGMDSRLGFAHYKSRGKFLFASPHDSKT
ncbi:membrane magnesium transporter-domain-containing protein [Suillus subalutaceus]|uniref:membrane magnesium transporter-domain-containing protein n=1 Tax=Suillus subalutaceus TaxID=48586 RepID=UPI001B8828C4|nr:membrane magnesium transporter-domain-containing protein [Suillus subalutaceus]KAG1860696.1 membrane magnesium transporter-domain-containing protein [Suillus subalutaceus]